MSSRSSILFFFFFRKKKFQEPIYETGINIVGLLPGAYFGDSRDRPIVLV